MRLKPKAESTSNHRILKSTWMLSSGIAHRSLAFVRIAQTVFHHECCPNTQADTSPVLVSWPRLLAVADDHSGPLLPKHTSLLFLAFRTSISALFAAQES